MKVGEANRSKKDIELLQNNWKMANCPQEQDVNSPSESSKCSDITRAAHFFNFVNLTILYNDQVKNRGSTWMSGLGYLERYMSPYMTDQTRDCREQNAPNRIKVMADIDRESSNIDLWVIAVYVYVPLPLSIRGEGGRYTGIMELEINLDNHKVIHVSAGPVIHINKNKLDFEENQVVEVIDLAKTTLAQIYMSLDRAVVINLPAHEFQIIFGNTSTIIEASSGSQGRLCGLCGGWTGETETELRNPGLSIIREPQLFGESYKLKEFECQEKSPNIVYDDYDDMGKEYPDELISQYNLSMTPFILKGVWLSATCSVKSIIPTPSDIVSSQLRLALPFLHIETEIDEIEVGRLTSLLFKVSVEKTGCKVDFTWNISLNSQRASTEGQKEEKPSKTIKITNQFDAISDQEEPMETAEGAKEPARENSTQDKQPRQRIPPIVVRGTTNYSKITKAMKEKLKGTYKIFYIKEGLKLQVATLEDFKSMQTYLKLTGQEYHTFTLPRDRPLKVVIKGLPPNMTTDEIKEELREIGYTPTDRAHGRGGGTAVFIRNYLPHYRSTIQDTENLEATAVTVSTKSGHINIVAAYNPPTKMLLKKDLDTVTAGDHFLIGVYLNCKNTLWNSRLTNRQGRILEEHASDAEYNVLAPESPTYYPANHLHRPDVLDIIMTNLKTTNETLTVLQELDSDHNPILCEWDVDTEHKNNWRKPNIKTTNWMKFNTELQENIPRNLVIESQEDVNAAIDVLTMTIQETYRVNTKTSQKQQDIRSDQPDLNYLIAQKREARRDWQRLRTQQERTRYNRLKAQVRRTVNEYRRAKWNTYRKKVGTPAIHGQRGMAYTSIDKANAIAETQEQQFSPSPVQEIEFNNDPVILYGCVGWGYAAGTHIKKLQTIQNKVLRTITGTDIRTRVDHLHEITKTKTLQEIFKERREKFYKQSAEHGNPLIQKLGNYDPLDRRSYKRPRLE
uniref:VWFD domain-containing protein n=1 Tax=Timema douglasi TaxID=61478 RepID=A0A7R8Z944_TIMDO|nr:unnamed protein product [Timema douglasi]